MRYLPLVCVLLLAGCDDRYTEFQSELEDGASCARLFELREAFPTIRS